MPFMNEIITLVGLVIWGSIIYVILKYCRKIDKLSNKIEELTAMLKASEIISDNSNRNKCDRDN